MDISSLGEFELIARLTKNLPAQPPGELGVGDDCAILTIGEKLLLLATTDSQVEGVHFTLETSTPEQIGRRALAVNLSDIAAMGGTPRYALISLILPPHLPLEVLEGIYVGLYAQARAYATAIVGGNIASSGTGKQLIIDITLLGTGEQGQTLIRSGAQPGDTLCVTGYPGDSAAGLHTLLYPDQPYPCDAAAYVRAVHRNPQPRIHEGHILSQFGPAIITSALDISDGLSGDIQHLCERSGVSVSIDTARIPLSPALLALAEAAQHDPLQWAIHGGEDYELLFTVSPGHEQMVIEAVQGATGTPVTPVGKIYPPDAGNWLLYPDGHQDALEPRSWDHLKH